MIELEKYEIEEEIGRGGVAVVYRARHKTLESKVAIKVLFEQFSHEPEFVKRFINGARNAALLKHPNIIPVYDVGDEGGHHYIVMEYLEGETLKERIAREGAFTEGKLENIIRPLAKALEYAHDKGVIHRDVKSDNIFMKNDGNVVLMDFDIAKALDMDQNLTRDGSVLGTPAYMSPEQALGQKSDHKGDIYSFGVVMYEMATGRLPFEAENPLSVLRMIAVEDPPPPREISPLVSEKLQTMILWCMEKEPEDRPERLGEIFAADDLAAEKARKEKERKDEEEARRRKEDAEKEKLSGEPAGNGDKQADETTGQQAPLAEDDKSGRAYVEDGVAAAGKEPARAAAPAEAPPEKEKPATEKDAAAKPDKVKTEREGKPDKKPPAQKKRVKAKTIVKTVLWIIIAGALGAGAKATWPPWEYDFTTIPLLTRSWHYTGKLPQPASPPADLEDVARERVKNLYAAAMEKLKADDIGGAIEELGTITDFDPGNRKAQRGRQRIYSYFIRKADAAYRDGDLEGYCRFMDMAVEKFPEMRLDNLYQRARKFHGSRLLLGKGDKNAISVYKKIVRTFPDDPYVRDSICETLEKALKISFEDGTYKASTDMALRLARDLTGLSARLYVICGDIYYTNNMLITHNRYNAAAMYTRALGADGSNSHARDQLIFISTEIRNRLSGITDATQKRSLVKAARDSFPQSGEFLDILDELEKI